MCAKSGYFHSISVDETASVVSIYMPSGISSQIFGFSNKEVIGGVWSNNVVVGLYLHTEKN